MVGWPDRRLLDLSGAHAPIIQAPMAGAGGVALAIAAIAGGATGSLPAGMIDAEWLREQVAEVRARTNGPLNLNFFCHALADPPDETAWRALLAPYYRAEGVAPGPPPPLRRPFDDAMCAVVEATRPQLVSFHFGLPAPDLFGRVRATGAAILGNATTCAEAIWLAERGCDAIIVQGAEAGGHAGWFLDRHRPQPLADLLCEIGSAVDLPLVAAGGIVDGRDIVSALALGAAGVQIGTAYLATPESIIAPPFRALLGTPAAADGDFTNLFSGREARGIRNRLMRELGSINGAAPAYPHASNALAPLRAAAEADGRGDYSPLWAGRGAACVRSMPARELTETLASEALALLGAARENA